MAKPIGLSLRFRIEVGLATAAIVAAIVTTIWPQWIEIVFKVDPDDGSGLLEQAIVLALVAISVGNSILAGRDWRHARAAANQGR